MQTVEFEYETISNLWHFSGDDYYQKSRYKLGTVEIVIVDRDQVPTIMRIMRNNKIVEQKTFENEDIALYYAETYLIEIGFLVDIGRVVTQKYAA
jgi:hypothetical protein